VLAIGGACAGRGAAGPRMSERGGSITREGERSPAPHGRLPGADPPGRYWRSRSRTACLARIPLPMELQPSTWRLLTATAGAGRHRHGRRRLAARSARGAVLGGRLTRIFQTHDHPGSWRLARGAAPRRGLDVGVCAPLGGEFLVPIPRRGPIRGSSLARVEVRPVPPARGDHREWYGGLPPLASPVDGDIGRPATGWRCRDYGTSWPLACTMRHGACCQRRPVLLHLPNVSVLSSAPRRTRCEFSLH
jgi:hypothetical protein